MKGLQRSIARGKQQLRDVVVQRVAIDTTLSFLGVTDTVVRQQAVIGDFPEGNILFLGAVAYLTLTGPTSANLTNDFEGDYSIGSTPNADTSLATTEVDIVASTPIGPATAEVAADVRGTNAAAICGTVLNNTDGSLELNLNVLLDANEVTNAATVVITATGVVELAYIVLGDD